MPPSAGYEPHASLLFDAIESYLKDHPKVRALAFYVPAARLDEHPHQQNRKGFWSLQTVSQNKAGIANGMSGVILQVLASHEKPNGVDRILEVIGDAILDIPRSQLQIDSQHYVTWVERSSIRYPTIFREQAKRFTGGYGYEFHLKRKREE